MKQTRRSFILFPAVFFVFLLGAETVRCLKFILEPEDTVVPRGSSVVLNCAVSGAGLPRISWKKDGDLLSFIGDTRSSDSIDYERSILANGSLHITSLVSPRDSRTTEEGTYQCVATLDGTGAILSRSAKVQTASLSRFTAEPEDLTTSLGHTARFECSAQGVPTPTVVWFKDNEPLVLDDARMIVLPSGSLEIRKVKETDEGAYKCQGSNMEGSQLNMMSKSGRLVLNPSSPERDTPPAFTAVPKSTTITTGSSLVLECSAAGHPTPKLSWLKDGVTIEIDELRYSIIGEGNLQISAVEESDQGTYQCRAENREDSVDVSATVEVHVPPKVLASSPINSYAYEKEDVELGCKITGRPPPTIQWYKNGERIIEGDYFQIGQGNSLKILGLVSTDAGMYQCFGSNPAGNAQSAVQLHVLKPDQKMPKRRKSRPRFMDFDELPLMDSLPFPRHFSGQIIPTPSSDPDGLDRHHPHPSGGSSVPSAPRDLIAAVIKERFVTLTWKSPILTNGNIIAYAVYYKEIGSDRERVLNTTKGRLEEVNIQGLLPGKRYTFRVVPYNEKGPGLSSGEISVNTLAERNAPSRPQNLLPVSVTSTSITVVWNPPEVSNGNIQRYQVYYVEAGVKSSTASSGGVKLLEEEGEDMTQEEGEINHNNNGAIRIKIVNVPEVTLEDLRIFKEYVIWIIAYNQDGPGEPSEELRVTTLSDVPSEVPHNVTVEPASSTSVIVRWEPPPQEYRNGIITGYKIKYKQKKKRAETVTTDGNTLFLVLDGLEKGAEYQIRLAAINVNGTGPPTEWILTSTFERDLDESRVPHKPAGIQAQASSDSITISWMPPRNQGVMIRGYTIGWGRGIPDIYTKIVEGKRRVFTIEELDPTSDYVISVRAFNQIGDGEPVYVNERTKSASEEEEDGAGGFGSSASQLPPPIGLRAIILSSTSAVLYWTDSSLSRTQVPTDNRFYMVRYLPTDESQGKKKFVNTTQMNMILDDLKPGTQYEFSVKVVRGRLSSEWSLVAINTTFSLALLAPPQDLTVMGYTLADGTSNVIVNWQPPKATGEDDNGIKGYVIFYTTKPSLKEWVEESVPPDVLTHKVQGLTPDTHYYFRMAAKYPKGLGLYTDIKSSSTPPAKTIYTYGNVPGFGNRNSGNIFDQDIRTNDIILYVLIGLSILLALASMSLCIYYRRKGSEASPNKNTAAANNSLRKNKKPDNLKPPDLWIHHEMDHIEMKEKGRRGGDGLISPSSRGSREFTDLEEKVPLNTNSLDKKAYLSSYLGGGNEGRSNTLTGRSMKSQLLSDTSGHLSDGTKTYETTASGSSAASSQNNLHTMAQYSATSEYGTQSGGSMMGTINRRTLQGQGGNMKSFGGPPMMPVPGFPPYQPNTPQNKMNIRPMGGGVVGIHPSNDLSAQRSPVKRVSTSQLPPMMVGFSKSVVVGGSSSGENSPLQKCYSTEELSQEISNLEGLMKDLNAITASEFQC